MYLLLSVSVVWGYIPKYGGQQFCSKGNILALIFVVPCYFLPLEIKFLSGIRVSFF